MQKTKNLFKTSNEFSLHIENIAASEKIDFYQALLNFCDEEGIDYEDVAKNLSRSLKEKIAKEFSDMGLMKKTAELDEQ